MYCKNFVKSKNSLKLQLFLENFVISIYCLKLLTSFFVVIQNFREIKIQNVFYHSTHFSQRFRESKVTEHQIMLFVLFFVVLQKFREINLAILLQKDCKNKNALVFVRSSVYFTNSSKVRFFRDFLCMGLKSR